MTGTAESTARLQAHFVRTDALGWRSDGFLTAIELLKTDYPASAYDKALDLITVSLTNREHLKTKIANSLSDLAIFQHFELKPGPSHFRDEIVALLTASSAILSLHRGMSDPASAILRDASIAHPPSEHWLADCLPIPEGRLDGAMSVVAQLCDWCEKALAMTPPPKRGQPRKEALLQWGIQVAHIFRDATGQKPTRRVSNVPISVHQEQPLETGTYRRFANAILEPLGLSLSDDMAKRAISAAYGG